MTRRRVAAPRQERSRVTLDAILSAADRVVAQKGVKELSMREVAREADVSTGTLYQYFPNKESLVHALEKRAWEEIFGRVQARAGDRPPERSPFDHTVLVVSLVMDELLRTIATFGLSPLEELPPESLERRDGFVAWLGAALPALFTSAGVPFAPKNPQLAARVVFMIMINCARTGTHDAPPELATGEFAREIGLVVARYLFGSGSEAAARPGDGGDAIARPPDGAREEGEEGRSDA